MKKIRLHIPITSTTKEAQRSKKGGKSIPTPLTT